MTERTTEVRIFGQQATLRYSAEWFGYAVLTGRLIIGWVLFYSGITKLLDPAWSAGPFLRVAAESPGNPLGGVWLLLAGDWLWLVDPLNEWGLTVIGLSFLLGAFVRLGAGLGVVLMFLYYLASLPLEWGFVVDFHIVYILLMFALASVGAGRLLGLDYYLENNVDIPNPWARLLLG